MIASARRAARHYTHIAETASPVVAEIAIENAGFVEQWAELADKHAALAARVDEAAMKLGTTTRDFEDVKSKLDQFGLTPTVGLLLQHKKEQLDAWQAQDSQTLFTSQELSRSRQKQLELELVRRDGSNADAQAVEILVAEVPDFAVSSAEVGRDASRAHHEYLQSQVREMLLQRAEWIAALKTTYRDYQRELSEFDSVTATSVELTSKYRQLIDRHVTWIRSEDPLGLRDVRNLKGGLAALFNSRRSSDFGPALERKIKSSSVGVIGLLAWTALMLLVRWRARVWLLGIGRRKRMKEATAESRKLAACSLTVVVAFAFPAILSGVARWLATGFVSESTLHASAAFYAASLVALLVEMSRQLIRSDGFLDKHVKIDLPGRQRATTFFTIVGLGLVIAAYATTVMGLIDHGMWRGSLARFGFIGSMMLVAWTAHLALRPTGGFLEPLIARFGGSVIHRVRFVIYLAGIGFPFAMAALSALGYGFTTTALIKRAIITLVCVLVAGTLWAGLKILSARVWDMLTGAPAPPREFDEYGEIEPQPGTKDAGVLGEHFLELKHHLAFLGQCALVMAAIASFGWLWIDVFPNVRMGNPVVWTVQDTVNTASVDAAGNTVTEAVIETTPITALHLLMAAATLFVAFQLAKLLPALFDALVLQRVSFDEGMEHFSLVLGRCLLFGVGCLVACMWVGVRWHMIQWLAVGLTIGLGFGLQDMVRNLFGGLIVLFEKPARLGDLVSVGRVTGRVAAQKFRTTVLSDDDGREVIVPNQNFVSHEVVHWMGAGRLSVIPLEVAVTRDQRPADICRTLQELVIDQPDVLLTPAPQATLVCVGKRSQRIEVRAWIEEGPDPERYRNALLEIVTKFLREENLLASNQPLQPEMGSAVDEEAVRSHSTRSRRRSA